MLLLRNVGLTNHWPLLILVFVLLMIPDFASASQVQLNHEERLWLDAHFASIRFAPSPAYPPVSFRDELGNYNGLTMDYVHLLEQRLGIRFKIVNLPTWGAIVEAARKKEIDLVGNIQATKERETFLNFTTPYITIPNAIIVHHDGPDSLKAGQLGGMKVAMVHGYATIPYLKKQYPDINIIEVKDNTEALQKVSFRQVDVLVTDLAVATYLIDRAGITNLKVAGRIDYPWEVCFGGRKDEPMLIRILEKGLAGISEKDRNEILHKWIPIEYQVVFPSWLTWQLIFGIVTVIIMVIMGVMMWNASLASRVRKQTRLISESKWLLNAIINSTIAVIYVKTIEGRFTLVNDRFCEIFNLSREEVIGKSPHDIYSGEIAWEHLENDKQIVDLKKSSNFSEHADLPDGRHDYLSVKFPIFDSKGKVIAVGGISTDITERIRTEERIKNSLQEKEILIQEVHHRVKNNMQVIISLLKLQANRIDDDHLRDIFIESQSRIYAMAAVHETLHRSDNMASIDLFEYLSKLGNTILHTYNTNSGRIKLSINIKPVVLRLEQAYPVGLVFNELLSNALKYAFSEKDPGEIMVSGELQDSNTIKLVVSDNGVGLPRDFNWRTTDSLGIQIVRTLVENQLVGTIDLDSSRGARWLISFPIEKGYQRKGYTSHI